MIRDRAALGVFAVLFCWYMLFSSGVPYRGQAYIHFQGAFELVQGRPLPPTYVGPGQTFLFVPFALLSYHLQLALRNDAACWVVLILTANLFSALFTALTGVIVYRLARRAGHTPRLGIAAALLYGLATPAAVYAKCFFPQSTECFFLTLAVWQLVEARERRDARAPLIVSGLAFGVLILVKVAAVAYVPAVVLWLAMSRDGEGRRRGAARGLARIVTWAAPAAALCLLYFPYNSATHGDALDFGYAAERDGLLRFSTPLLVGLYGLLFSPGKGLAWYAPVLWLAVPGARRLVARDRGLALFILALLATALLVHSRWWGWHGDNAWGPRYIIPVLPILSLLAVERLRRAEPRGGESGNLRVGADATWPARIAALAVLALVALSAAIQALGAAFQGDAFQNTTYDTVIPHYRFEQGALGPPDDELGIHWIPEFSPLAGQAWLLRHALRGDAADAYAADAPWRALRPDGAWAPHVPSPPPEIDLWITRLPREYPTTRPALLVIAAACLAGILAGIALSANASRQSRLLPSEPREPASC